MMQVSFGRTFAWMAVVVAATALCALLAPAAARTAAGCDVIVYWDGDFSGEREEIKDDRAFVGPHWDHEISSLRVIDGQWAFFGEVGFRGEALRYGPGSYARLPASWNDRIGSMRCIGGVTAYGGDTTTGEPNGQASPDDDLMKATREIGYFYGHLMLPKELDRAKEIRRRFPSLATKVDALVAGQVEITDEEEREKREFRVEDETWQRDENEKRAKERHDPEAPSRAERLHAEAGLIPDACKNVEAGQTALYRSPWTEKISKATALREGGHIQAACNVYGEIKKHNETVSAAYAACNRQIRGIYTGFARQGMFDFFVLTLKIRMQVLEEVRCP